ncbi:hypothetical protein Sinac_7671 (plasmid) [Singulisphaera acidiphila DSM 18658]|uniref:Replication initiator protein A n=2 Tax=Singulisphaera acidiphila TaxID=466153 RepID=L0DRS9_SINAD|nr:hypothetical protein Sinac_7671 [Singulisphaera acidiphila DSM 18658]
METDPKPTTELVPVNTIRVETAFTRYPMHRLARKGNIEISISDGDERSGETRWEVDYSKKHGQPGPLAYKLDTLIINRRIEEARRPISRLLKLGSLSDICRELGLCDSGKNRSDVKKALYQNAFAGISTKTRYKQVDGTENTVEAAFTRYSVIFTGEKLPNGQKADGVYITLNDVFMRVINGAMTRPLDYDYLKSLPPAPQRFYELLSYQMYAALKYDRPRAKLVYSEFCAHAPQMRHAEWKRARAQMSKVIQPHLESGYIGKVDYQDTVDRDGQPDWIMLYMPGPKARAEFRAFNKRGGPNVLEIEPLESSLEITGPVVSELEAELIAFGVTPEIAGELVSAYSEERIKAQLERVSWAINKKPDKIDEPAAYLVEAIKKDFAAPKSFVSHAEKQRREEAKKKKDRLASEALRRQKQQEADEAAELQRADDYYAALSPEDQAAINSQADALATPGDLAGELAEGFESLRRIGQLIRRREFIRNLLRSSEPMAADA